MIRMDKDLYKHLAAAASQDGRSVNSQILYYIKQALASRTTSP